jgi:hypothetical protein
LECEITVNKVEVVSIPISAEPTNNKAIPKKKKNKIKIVKKN